jgi:outer membrane PBP1 activator LpoA protein
MTFNSSPLILIKLAQSLGAKRYCHYLMGLVCLVIISGCQTNTQPQATSAPSISVETEPTSTPIPAAPPPSQPAQDALVIHLDMTPQKPEAAKPKIAEITELDTTVAMTKVEVAAEIVEVADHVPVEKITSANIPNRSTKLVSTKTQESDSPVVHKSVSALAPKEDPASIAKAPETNTAPKPPAISPAQQQQQLLDLADSMLAAGYIDLSLGLLEQIEVEKLPPQSLSRYFASMATSYLQSGDSNAALEILEQAQDLDPNPDRANQNQRLTLLQQAYTDNQQFLSAALTAIAITNRYGSKLQTSDVSSANHDVIWDLLMQVSNQQLKTRLNSPIEPNAKAWLELALSTQGLLNLDQQQAAIMAWQLQYPLHAAALDLPKALAKLVELKPRENQKLALLLPTSGPLGKLGQAVIDGFMANYYQAMTQCEQPCNSLPQLEFINSDRVADWQQLYYDLEDQNVDLVIGPLDKAKVDLINELPERNITTLALNFIRNDNLDHGLTDPLLTETQVDWSIASYYPEQVLGTDTEPEPEPNTVSQNTLFQFSLSIEEEARQLATRGHNQGLHQALIIAANSDWSQRASKAFQQQWQALGGQVTGQVSFTGDGDHADSISQVLLTDTSKLRRKELQKTIATNVKFEPRRRQDVDLVVILALPEDARQLMPTLAFHHAGDITVYATHHAYQGPTKTTRDRDLNRLYFSDIPWMLEPDTVAQQVAAIWPNSQRYSRLFALGADAFLLYPRLQQMQIFSTTKLEGMTGLLRLDEQNRITANLTWARFQRGQPKVQNQ